MNNVYEVNSFEIVQSPTGVASDGVGIGTTHMSRVFVKIAEHLDWNGQWPSFSGAGIQLEIILDHIVGVRLFFLQDLKKMRTMRIH